MQPDTGIRAAWGRTWPALLAVGTVGAVGVPAAVASYRHARDVIAAHGDPVMAPWLPLSVDGLLVAALVVIWVRRHRGELAGVFPWCAFGFGMAVTVLANLAAVRAPAPGAVDVAVALFPPLALAVTLELVALIAYKSRPRAAAPAAAVAATVVEEPARVAVGYHDEIDDEDLPRDWWAQAAPVLDNVPAGEGVEVADPRVRDLADRLAAGEPLTGAGVGEQYTVSPRTGRRLIAQAADLHRATAPDPARLALVTPGRGV